MGLQYTVPEKDIDEWIDVPESTVKKWDESYEVPGRAGKLLDEDGGPYAVLVELNPGTVLEEHFHTENQWQVIVEGSARMHGEKLTPFTVHYTEKETAYGPIEAGGDGLTFLTLREEAPTGYHPANREEAFEAGTPE
jgi:hypothetical protein